MTTKITRDVLESYLHCKYKGNLKLTGQQGIKCDYESLLTEMRAEVRIAAIDKILARHAAGEILRHIPLTTSVLKQGASFLLDATLEDDLVSLNFDGLKKVAGASKLGEYHYVPILCFESRQVRKDQKLLLEIYGWFLSGVQGRSPPYGIIWHGTECKGTKVRLTNDGRRTERVLRELKELAGSEATPRLLLNDHCQLCEFRQRCHAQALQEDNLSLLFSMGEKEIMAYNRKGFFTVTQISHTFRYRKPRKRAKKHAHPHYFSLQARSIRTGLVHIHGTPSLPSAETRVYLDMEGIPDQDFYYLIGVLVEVGQSLNYHSFWADKEEEQDGLFHRLAELVGSLPAACPVFHYGNYETVAIKKVIGRSPPEKQEALQAVLARLVNVLSVVHRHVYFPTYSNTLKDIGKIVGHQWSNPDASGIQSLVWRERWERTHDPAMKEELLTYNKEDCAALKQVCDFIAYAEKARPGQIADNCNVPNVMQTSELPKPPSKWPVYGRPSFVLSDLERASKLPYFDYQRERVYVRTNKRFKQINRRSKPPRLPYTPNKRIVIVCETCPACGASKIKRKNRLKRKTVDMKFFKGGVKKWIVLYHSWAYQCDSCGTRFLPKEWLVDRSLYQRGLACWCVYENIECRQTMCQVKNTLADVFDLHVPQRQLYLFKSWIVERYNSMYEEIRASILRGHLAHIDEATVNLRDDEKGYVWVLGKS